jgi:hypothetical protein
MKKWLKYIFPPVFVFCSFFSSRAALCVSTGSGNWSTTGTWSCGHVPTCGDSIVIKTGDMVTISTQIDLGSCGSFYLTIQGTLQFVTGSKLKLPCGSVVFVFPGGSVQGGGGGGNSNYIEICNTIVWRASDPPLTGPSCVPTSNPLCGNILPVELIDFQATINGNSIDVKWSTATENNNDRYELERSTDAVTFETIGSVKSSADASGNSNTRLDYSFKDQSPIANTSYYRLKQFDKDNTFVYSPLLAVEYAKVNNVKFVVYPNPNHGEFTADISGLENNHRVRIVLKDEKGLIVYDSSFYLQEDSSRKVKIVPESPLLNGLYVCSLFIEDVEYAVKVVVS